MDINALHSEITKLNAQVKRLNTERQQSIGRKEALEKQLESSLRAYNEKYGKSITVDTIDEELRLLVQEKENEVSHVASIISAIQSGDYDLANKLAGIVTEEKPEAKANDEYIASNLPQEPVASEPVKTETAKFIPSPVHNPVNVSTGSVGNMGVSSENSTPSSIFQRDFSQSDDDEIAPPVAPPPLSDLI